ncbi:MAG TPA: 3-hydroxyacyl-CoA dehydrogenase family protein [Syntrophomonadaceae bacterium]|nr:3-hydroxyacyl-CoA dehydrogenase family protein [Syntrophomonadaceae bacterium]
MAIKTVGVLGAGAMGTGIVQVAAQAGYDVILCDMDMAFVEKGVASIDKVLAKNVEKGKMDQATKDAVIGRIIKTTNKADLAAVDYMIEVIVENVDIKKAVLAELDGILKPDVILATNTSSISISLLAGATKRGDKFVGMHFFNPVPLMRLCEIIRGYSTSDETVKVASELAQTFGKTTVEVKKDTPGFIVNRCMMPQFLEAIRLVETGVATPADIDTAVKLGLNYPMGPFELMDFTGIDISKLVLDVFFDETKDSFWAPPYTLKAIVSSGKLGKKTGVGWYDYKK